MDSLCPKRRNKDTRAWKNVAVSAAYVNRRAERRMVMRQTYIVWTLVTVVALVFGLSGASVPSAFAAKHSHKNLQEALEHLEKHAHDMLEALKGGHKVDPKVERAIIKDTEHVEEMLDPELEKAKKMKK
jgi:hypothetical protein